MQILIEINIYIEQKRSLKNNKNQKQKNQKHKTFT